MTPPIEFHPRAVDEIQHELAYYGSRNPAARSWLFAEIEAGIARIAEAPDRYEVVARGARRYLLKRFPFSIIYLATGDTIRIVAFAHAKRRPNYWKRRV